MKRVTNFIADGNKVCAYKKFWKKEMGFGVRKAHAIWAAQLRCRAFAAGNAAAKRMLSRAAQKECALHTKGFFLFPGKLSNHIKDAGKKTGGESFSGIFGDEHFPGNDIFFCFGEYGGKASAQTVCGESL